jgi:hypothetical protein
MNLQSTELILAGTKTPQVLAEEVLTTLTKRGIV